MAIDWCRAKGSAGSEANYFYAEIPSVILAVVKSKVREPRPTVSPARASAFDMLLRVERESSYASELLHSQTYALLSAPDHSLATELVMGVLRWQSVLDLKIAQSSSQPLTKLDIEVLLALRLALYQLGWLSRIPGRAAIHESVELVKRARKRSAAPFVNAVLRKLSAGLSQNSECGSNQIIGGTAEALAASSAHPLWLVKRWVQEYGLIAAEKICRQNQTVPITAIRLRDPEAEAKLRAEGIEISPGALLASARRIKHGDVINSSAYKTGQCVIQDEGSQLVAALVGAGDQILECCAAPGGKALALADRNPGAKIAAVELHPHRARLLRELTDEHDRIGSNASNNIRIITADARYLPLSVKFDRVLADVPCSGTGTLSRNPEIKWRLTFQDLLELHGRQKAILISAMAQVARGGRLVYSTCSLEREENEDVVEVVLAEDPTFNRIDCCIELERLHREGELAWSELSTLTRGPYLRTLPGVHPCDGFFAAILQKD